jgi:hypothetical protein
VCVCVCTHNSIMTNGWSEDVVPEFCARTKTLRDN